MSSWVTQTKDKLMTVISQVKTFPMKLLANAVDTLHRCTLTVQGILRNRPYKFSQISALPLPAFFGNLYFIFIHSLMFYLIEQLDSRKSLIKY